MSVSSESGQASEDDYWTRQRSVSTGSGTASLAELDEAAHAIVHGQSFSDFEKGLAATVLHLMDELRSARGERPA